jgi:hypothetical protein
VYTDITNQLKSSEKKLFTINNSNRDIQKLWELSERYKLIRERANGGV